MTYLKTSQGGVHVDNFPSTCPRCKRMIAAIFSGTLTEKDNDEEVFLEAAFICPHCYKLLIAHYQKNSYLEFILAEVFPSQSLWRSFTLIRLVSERFEELWNQASMAESHGLHDISGTGYRKALEFLIKDYCVALNPKNSAVIKKKYLGNVIDDRVDDGKLKTAARLSTWLGNNEVHYERRWVDKDLSDLKALINIVISFVEEEIQLEQYVQSMQPNTNTRLLLLSTTSNSRD